MGRVWVMLASKADKHYVPRNPTEADVITPAETYRANAVAQRLSALQTSLPSRRAMHERSALAWEQMADAAEDTAAKASVNAAAKYADERPQSGSHKGWHGK